MKLLAFFRNVAALVCWAAAAMMPLFVVWLGQRWPYSFPEVATGISAFLAGVLLVVLGGEFAGLGDADTGPGTDAR